MTRSKNSRGSSILPRNLSASDSGVWPRLLANAAKSLNVISLIDLAARTGPSRLVTKSSLRWSVCCSRRSRLHVRLFLLPFVNQDVSHLPNLLLDKSWIGRAEVFRNAPDDPSLC